MGMFPENSEGVQEEVKEEIKTEEVIEMGGEKSIARIVTGEYAYIEIDIANTTLEDAKKQLDVVLDLSNYRDSLLGMNKQASPTQPVQAPTKVYTPQEGKLPYFKFTEHQDQEVALKIISDDGEYQINGMGTHGFTVEYAGAQYKLSTTAKVLLPLFVPGAELIVKMFKEVGTNGITYTKYEVI